VLAVIVRLLVICRSPGTTVARRGTQRSGAAAVLRRTKVPIAARRSMSGQRRQIASVCRRVASSGRFDTGVRSLVALPRAAIANVAREVMLDRVAAVGEVAIAGRLILVGRSLIAVGRSLIAVGRGLVGICERLMGISERLIVLDPPEGGATLSCAVPRPPRWSNPRDDRLTPDLPQRAPNWLGDRSQ
jgi:hypothetical protein